MVSDMHEGELRHRSVNACLYPLYAAEGKHIVTVEGGLHEPTEMTWPQIHQDCHI